MLGLMKGGLFAFGGVSGGKRARSVSSIRLEHVIVSTMEVKVDGVVIVVPSISIKLEDEKFMDVQGMRSVTEWLRGCEDYAQWGEFTYSYWVYDMLVVRGAFKDAYDPLLTAKSGVPLKETTQLWYLFCDVDGDKVVNTMPVSPRRLSAWTESHLRMMGSEGRGFSAHRRGGITRAMIMELINKGTGVKNSIESVLLRWGGWDCMNGLGTIRRVYLEKTFDSFMDRMTMAYGRVTSDAEWEEKRKEFMGEVRKPSGVVVERGVKALANFKEQFAAAWTVKQMAMRDSKYMEFQSTIDLARMLVMAIGRVDIFKKLEGDTYDVAHKDFTATLA